MSDDYFFVLAVAVCLQVLAGTDTSLAKVWLEDCRHAFAELTSEKQSREAAEAKKEVSWPAQTYL